MPRQGLITGRVKVEVRVGPSHEAPRWRLLPLRTSLSSCRASVGAGVREMRLGLASTFLLHVRVRVSAGIRARGRKTAVEEEVIAHTNGFREGR